MDKGLRGPAYRKLMPDFNRYPDPGEVLEQTRNPPRPAPMRQRIATWRHYTIAALCATFATAGAAADKPEQRVAATDFSRLSIEELGDIEISSVSKRPERLSNAAAAIYIITREDILRSGAITIPEVLRLAPNLQVAQIDSSQYAISARGFNTTSSDKLLVLIDGRSVYSPVHSAVFWDVQDTVLADIERIEVISGPGGTLWGSNAVNGVINIITRDTRDTIGTMADFGGGTEQRKGAVRYGGKLNEESTYRLYAKSFSRNDTVAASGASQQDAWRTQQAGFRMDWRNAGDTLMFEGNVYDGTIDQKVGDDKTISGNHLLGRWNRKLDDRSMLQVQAYYDQAKRIYPGTYSTVIDTLDIDVQHRFQASPKHDIVWGGGYRLSRDDVRNTPTLAFLPARRNLTLANVFAHDSIALDEHLQLTLGAKLEHNSYTGMEFQPNVRLAWKLQDNALLWSSIARAVRTPSRIDRELYSPDKAPFLLAGGPNFKSEKLTAYEIGYRAQPAANASFSLSTFYNVYDELRTIELQPGGSRSGGPYVFDNKMDGHTWGVEMWGSYRIRDWWRVSAGYNYLKEQLRLMPDSSANNGTQSTGNDPSHQFSARSSMNLAHNVELDVAVRAIGALPNPAVPAYTALDMRLAWAVAKNVNVSLTGVNLTDRQHAEFGSVSARSEPGRSFYLRILWNY